MRRASAGSGACLSSALPLSCGLPLPLALASLVHHPTSHCSRGLESGRCFPQTSAPSAPSLTFVSKACFFYLSSDSGLWPLLTSNGPLQGMLLSASPPMLLRQQPPNTPPPLHPCDGTTSQLSSGLCDSPFSPLHGPPILISSPLLCP